MGIEEYSVSINKNLKNRLGCSVCLKTNSNDSFRDNSSVNKLKFENKQKNNFTSENYNKCKKTSVLLKPRVNECYCHYMEHIKRPYFPKLICSKQFQTPNILTVDKNWLDEIKKFRQENWFDCHSDSFIDANFLQNINSLHLSNKHELNYNDTNDLTCFDHPECNELQIESTHNNIYLECPDVKKTYAHINKRTTKPKYANKKKNVPSTVVKKKPWIPPSKSF